MWSGSRFVLLFLLCLILMSCTASPVETVEAQPEETREPVVEETSEPVQEETVEPETTEEDMDPIEQQLSNMTLKEKIYQLFIFGAYGTEPSEHLINHVQSGLGGVIFFSRNIQSAEQLKSFTEKLRSLEGDIPLLLSTDEEGGRVQRLAPVAEAVPRAFDVTEETAFDYGASLGRNLRSFDLNTGYAPVLDVFSNEANTVIGDRALSRSAEGVITYLPEVLRGLESEGILTVGKHFPGHGDTAEDSHEQLPTITKSLEELESLELIPFKKAIELDIDMMMVGHLLVEAMDENLPASLSSAVIEDYLRGELGYQGVVVTDDLTMGAIVNNYSIHEVVENYLLAGGDLLLVGHDEAGMDEYINATMALIEQGRITEDQLDEKVFRILTVKSHLR